MLVPVISHVDEKLRLELSQLPQVWAGTNSEPCCLALLCYFNLCQKIPKMLTAMVHTSQFSSLSGNTGLRTVRGLTMPSTQGLEPSVRLGMKPRSPILETQYQPPSFSLESALEFLCSQCIPLEGCPPRVAMVTILVLHARKS